MRKSFQYHLLLPATIRLLAVILIAVLLLTALSACSLSSGPKGQGLPGEDVPVEWLQSSPTPRSPSMAVQASPRLLTVCMASEPASLFIYADASVAARSVRQTIYDGPFDRLAFDLVPVILESKPTMGAGEVSFEPLTVEPGDQIVDSQGNLINLGAGVVYYPSGCMGASCTQEYAGEGAVQIDQLVVRFRLRPGVQWSDGVPLTAGDSLYSYEVAKGLYPRVRPDLISRTQSYQALDENTVEWRGLPGYRREDYATYFFTPLPRHAWGQFPLEELLVADAVNRSPIGWGPYVIEEWTPGDHISLNRNPNYFRGQAGLPAFDKLVFRFIPERDDAIDALLAGECDYLDETLSLEVEGGRLSELRDAGRLALAVETGSAWEQLAFGVASLDPQLPGLFQSIETRQAVAMCLDRVRLAQYLLLGEAPLPLTYVHPAHPLANPNVRQYAYDPAAAAALLERVGWLDEDGDPGTPRLAVGVPGVPDGTLFEVSLLTTDEPQKQQAALILQESLAQCGIRLAIVDLSWETLLAPGPEGLVFGRKFSLAQFGWISALYPPCSLYTTGEIPGPYPDYPKGWGGANASGYSNPAYDRTCQQALASLPEMPEHRDAHFQAQQIYAEELPTIPLYLHPKMIVTRPDMCDLVVDPSAESALWNLENFDYGEGCR